jgi:hypothetical protein
MPEFESYIEVEVDEFLSACTDREREDLIDCLEEDGWVKRVATKGSKKPDLSSIPDLEWQEMIARLSGCRMQVTTEDEELLKKIANKYF